jgi:hypothetical protein
MKKILLLNIIVFMSGILFSQDISGTWNWQFQNGKHISEIVLISNGPDSYHGYYCSTFYEGRKVDCSNSELEICITVDKTQENTFVGTFESPSFNGNGNIKLVYYPLDNKLKIELINPEGEYYLPNNVFYE